MSVSLFIVCLVLLLFFVGGGGGEGIFPIYIVNLFAFPKMFPFYPRVPHLINIERAYANSVVNNDMDRIIDIFGRRNGRDSYFF